MKLLACCLALILYHVANAHVTSHRNPKTPNEAGDRPSALVDIGNGTYYLSPPGTVASWEAAMMACNQMDMALVSFETKAEFHAIRDYMETNGYNSQTWTSGRTYTTGEWMWTSSGRILTEKAWGADQPHLTSKCYPCIIFAQDSKGWMDTECLEELAYICEQ